MVLKTRIIFTLLCASIINAHDLESKYLPSLEEKLDGERSVNPSNYRFMASLRRNDIHICPATLLSNKYALTAATCLKGFLNETKIPSFDTFSLVAGRFDIDNKTTVFEIEQVQVNRKFSFISPTVMRNIGLITMRDNDFEASEYVGWGFRIQELLKPSEAADLLIWRNIYELPRIQKITLRIIEGKYCNYYNNSPIICTVSDQKNMNLSEEDLGSPLIQENVVSGILASVPEKSEQSAIFVDVFKSKSLLDILFHDYVIMNKNARPRRKARHDCFGNTNKRRRNTAYPNKTNHEETNHMEKNH